MPSVFFYISVICINQIVYIHSWILNASAQKQNLYFKTTSAAYLFCHCQWKQNMRYLYHDKNRFIHKKKEWKKLKFVEKKKQIEFLATASCNFIMQILSAQCIALALGNPLLWPGAESCGPTASKIRSQVTQFQLSLFHNCIPGVY